MNTSLVWFRNDLRLADNPALQAACARSGKVALLYILDERAGAASRWWLHHSLAALSGDITARGGVLILRRGDPVRIVPELAAALGADEVHAARAFEPFWRACDRAIDAALKAQGRRYVRHLSTSLFAPEAITTQTGKPFAVFTPFSRACLAAGVPDFPPLPAPEKISGILFPSETLENLSLLPRHPDWAGGLRKAWTPGEAGALARLQAFDPSDYAAQRDVPALPATSRLSPHAHFGEISPRRVWNHIAPMGAPKFLAELLWREFSLHLLWQYPNIRKEPIRTEFAAFPWREDDIARRAWQRGQTGVPIVDAGMRELWHTGWMHNRVRMICASFLVKHLLIPWQHGEGWFWDTLVDADEAANSASWQWVTGCGADAAPYFRIFNPVLQGQKFDPNGVYVRRFVPELARMPDRFLHAPWEAPANILKAAGVELGLTYPQTLVDLAAGRARALAACATLPPPR